MKYIVSLGMHLCFQTDHVELPKMLYTIAKEKADNPNMDAEYDEFKYPLGKVKVKISYKKPFAKFTGFTFEDIVFKKIQNHLRTICDDPYSGVSRYIKVYVVENHQIRYEFNFSRSQIVGFHDEFKETSVIEFIGSGLNLIHYKEKTAWDRQNELNDAEIKEALFQRKIKPLTDITGKY